MAAKSFPMLFRLQLVLATILTLKFESATASDQCFESIISFGDSIADTGNAAYLFSKSGRTSNNMAPPYGETYFCRPTGRYSDGRLIIDFIAEELGLPFVQPSQEGGTNFAVGAATALNDSFFEERGVRIPIAGVSLAAQMSWFKQFLSKNCYSASGCRRFLQSSLVFMGEIGGNDYNHPFFQGKNELEVQSFMPEVIKTIGSTIEELISLGAMTLMVPGNFPIGCSATYLTYFNSNNKTNYDSETGCINWLNRFSEKHNDLLKVELNRVQMLHPYTTIIYGDYYNPTMEIYRYPQKHGFTGGSLKACCGGKGPYNVIIGVQCGTSKSKTCTDPSLYVNWDGVHFTEAAYKLIAKSLVQGSNITPLGGICTRSPSLSVINVF